MRNITKKLLQLSFSVNIISFILLAFESDCKIGTFFLFPRNNIFAVAYAKICRELKLLNNFSNRFLLLINELLIKKSYNWNLETLEGAMI